MTTINYTLTCAFMSSTYTRVVDLGHNLSLKKHTSTYTWIDLYASIYGNCLYVTRNKKM
jgi:hypothetical protein